ncbi:MAG: hypothetical protein AB6733_19825 [Clostridiaceae bacterium]
MDLTIISSITFFVALLASYFAANKFFEAVNTKHSILVPFQLKLIESKRKKLIKRYYLLAAFTLYIIFSGLLGFNDLENGIFLGIWSSFILLVYKPFQTQVR